MAQQQQVYGKNREEPYAPRYGPQKPFFKNYYPSSGNNNPQTLVVTQVETVTRELVNEPTKEMTVNHHREDEFINRIRDETVKATAEFNNSASPKVLSSDQIIQLSHGNDRLSELADPNQNHPRKVAELMSRVSNWRGADYRAAKPPMVGSDGYGNSGSRSSSYDYNGNRGRATDDVYSSSRMNEVRYDEAPRQRVTSYGNWGNQPAPGRSYMYNGDDRVDKVAEYDQAVFNANGNSGLGLPKRSSSHGLTRGDTSSTVITSTDAVTKYRGSFV